MPKNQTTFSFLLNSIKPFKLYIALHLLVIFWNAINISLWPYISKLLVNELAATPNEQLLASIWPIALLLIILTILPGFIWRIADYSWANLIPMLHKKITCEVMDCAMQHSASFFQNNFSGSLASKVRDLSDSIPTILQRLLYSFLNVFLSLIFAFFALFSIHKFFAFGLIFWAILFIAMALRASKISSEMSVAIADQKTKIHGNLVDLFGNISNVKFFAKTAYESSKIKDLQDGYTKFFRRRNYFFLRFYTIHGLTFSTYFTCCIIALIWLYAQGLVTLGDFLMLFAINHWMIDAMWSAANEMNGFLEDVGTVNQALQIINQPLEIKDQPDAKILKVRSGKIEFRNVSFSYPNSAPLFCEKNITIAAGQKLGLVGHSGSGKTSFMNLILRFFDLKTGKILIDEQDIACVTQNSLRSAIAVIPQEPSLFHRTLAENIAYGKNEASALQIIEAAKKSHAHEFIEKLPDGYDSLVGERGVKLSGGQRQRIAIARAFLKNAPILILDEATSQLDSITENLIQESLRNLMQGKTTIVIAHRLSTLRNMDRILVFDSGKIIEDDSHQELLERNGAYKKLWDAQIGGFLAKDLEFYSLY